jgi:hypothetical protein
MGEHKRPRREPSLYRTRLGHQLRFGVVVGLALAALYCVYAAVLFVVRGDAPFEKHNVSLRAVLATYVTLGIGGGIAYGLLHPLARSLFGRAVLGVLIATLVFFGITVATDGLPSHWERAVWQQPLILGGLFGLPIGLLWRRVTGR